MAKTKDLNQEKIFKFLWPDKCWHDHVRKSGVSVAHHTVDDGWVFDCIHCKKFIRGDIKFNPDFTTRRLRRRREPDRKGGEGMSDPRNPDGTPVAPYMKFFITNLSNPEVISKKAVIDMRPRQGRGVLRMVSVVQRLIRKEREDDI